MKQLYIGILKLGFPILVAQIGMIIVGFADTQMLGVYSTDALAAASFVNNLFNVCIFACIGFTYGITPLAGALFGQKLSGRVGMIVKNGLLLNILFSIFICLVMLVVYFNLHRLGQPPHLLPLIRPYFLIFLAGIIPISVFNVFAQWSYAVNRTKMPMWIILAANILNIFGNWILIYGNLGFPEMGLVGAGYATLVARILCPLVILPIFFFGRQFRSYALGFRASKISFENLKRVNSTSFPVALQMTFESGSFTIAAIMAGWIGAISLAAFQVIVILGTLGFCVYYSMASAVSVLVSNATGKLDFALMRRTAFAGYHILLLLAACSSLIFFFFGDDIIRWFTRDEDVIFAATALIFPLILYQLADATQINFSNALRGTSRVLPMIWIAFVSYIIIGIPVTYLFGFIFRMGLYGIILSFSVSLLIAAACYLFFFLRASDSRYY